jgi:hypothetical protein
MQDFNFNPPTGFNDTNIFPAKPGAQARSQIQSLLDQIKAFFNGEVKSSLADITKYPGAKAWNNVAQSIANNTETVASFNSEDFDTDTIHDAVTNNSRLTCKTAGKYLVVANIIFDVSSTGNRNIYIRQNGGTNRYGEITQGAIAGEWTFVNTATVLQLNVNDYVELVAKQTSGGALSLVSASQRGPYLSMVKVG